MLGGEKWCHVEIKRYWLDERRGTVMGSDFQVPKPLAERLVPFKITAIYTVIGGLWILFSD